MEQTILRYGIIVRAPYETFNCANLDYGVVEHLIALRSGGSYEHFMERRVFAPLGLTHTSVGPLPELRDATSAPYSDGGARLPRMDLDQRGAGYIYSSVSDMARFGMFHLKEHLREQQPVSSDETIDAMVENAPPTGDGTGAYGLGWYVQPEEHGSPLTTISHTGAMAGFAGVLKLIPEKRVVVAVMANSTQADTVGLSEEIISALAPEYATARARARGSVKPAPQSAFPSAEFVGMWKGTIATWKGRLPITMDVRPDGGVIVQFAAQPKTALTNIEFQHGELDGSFEGTIPTPDAQRDRHRVYLDRLIVRGHTLRGTAIADGGAHFALPSYIEMKKT